MSDYYQILGINKTASKEEIKRAYRRLAHKYHPDKPGGNEEKFKEINEAYQTLSDDEKRGQYDRFGRAFSSGGPFGWQPGGGAGFSWDFDLGGIEDATELEEIFNAFFEGLGIKQKRRTYRRGADLELATEITLEEAKSGKVVTSEFETLVECSNCGGLGYRKEAGLLKCEYCSGRGEIKETQQSFFGSFNRVVSCNKCHGTGQIPKEACQKCAASGRVKGKRTVRVEVRPGVLDNQLIKIPGMGEIGEHQAGAGDLYIKVKVKPHPVFERRGNDLYRELSVNLLDVLLEKELKLTTLDGKEVRVGIPRGFDLNSELRIKGEGMTKDGDLVTKLNVKTPKHLSAKAKKLLEDLEKELGD